jgi:hypothetical protein
MPVVLPLLAGHILQRRLAGRPLAWRREAAVVGRPRAGGSLQLTTMRCPRPDASVRCALPWAGLAGLLDVAAGTRCWWGARPRSADHWYTLRPEWQRILAQTPVGLLHAPVWVDQAAHEAEAMAAADVYWVVQTTAQRLRQSMALLWR